MLLHQQFRADLVDALRPFPFRCGQDRLQRFVLCDFRRCRMGAGLSVSDYIAYPDGTVSEGMKTTTEYPASEPEGFEMTQEEYFGSYVPEEEPIPGTEPEESEVSG